MKDEILQKLELIKDIVKIQNVCLNPIESLNAIKQLRLLLEIEGLIDKLPNDSLNNNPPE